MALDRRVATAAHQPSSEIVGRPGARLDRVPTQRGPLAGTVAPSGASPSRRARAVLVAVALIVTAALVAGFGLVQHQRSVRGAEQVRIAAAQAATAARLRAQVRRSDAAVVAAGVADARADLRTAAAAAARRLAADVHAGTAQRASLKAAVDVANVAASDPDAGLGELTAAAAGIAAPVKAADAAESSWQAAQQKAAAAAAAAAQQAAREAAAQQAAASKATTPKTVSKAAAKPKATASSSGAAKSSTAAKPSSSAAKPKATAAAGGRAQAIPAGGLACPGAHAGATAGESSVAAIGAAINAYRASHGLPALTVVRSGTLVAHAEDMAASGGIWHSGKDNIVGCTSGSVQSLLNAWANSAPHRAQMLRTGVTTMLVGGATAGGYLYGAVKFN